MSNEITETQAEAPPTAPAAPPPALPVTPFDKVAAAISAITAEIAEHPILKEGRNTFHGYNFARLQDIITALAPIMSKHGLTILQSERERGFMDKGNAIFATYDFTIMHNSGQVWPLQQQQTGVANTRTSKGTFDDKGLNKCHSAARKFFLMSLFQIPTTDDPDRTNVRRPTPPSSPAPATAQPPVNPNEPVMLERVGNEPWDNWAHRFLNVLGMIEDVDKVERWLDTNKPMLEKLRADLPNHHAHLMRQYQKRILQLQPSET
jgi:hypothetical protein